MCNVFVRSAVCNHRQRQTLQLLRGSEMARLAFLFLHEHVLINVWDSFHVCSLSCMEM